MFRYSYIKFIVKFVLQLGIAQISVSLLLYLYGVARETFHLVEGLVGHHGSLRQRLEHIRLLLLKEVVRRVPRGGLFDLGTLHARYFKMFSHLSFEFFSVDFNLLQTKPQ